MSLLLIACIPTFHKVFVYKYNHVSVSGVCNNNQVYKVHKIDICDVLMLQNITIISRYATIFFI